jgi:cobalt/nickel transport system permease protein
MAYIDLPALPFPHSTPMHIPDGFLSGPVAGVGYALAAVFVALAVWRTNRSLGEKSVPLMGVTAAFIFAVQMMNFPVAGGTSGHLLGGTLAAILVGPWAAIIVMTSVIGIQGLMFQDGGLSALGFNVLNMGVITALVGYSLYYLSALLANGRRGWVLPVGVFVASWLTVMLAALACSLELAVSHTSPLHVVLPAMMGVHAFIGIGEGLITAAAVTFVLATRPDLIEQPQRAAPQGGLS